jgi:hypothetical protein
MVYSHNKLIRLIFSTFKSKQLIFLIFIFYEVRIKLERMELIVFLILLCLLVNAL